MGDPGRRDRFVVLSRRWAHPHDETSFVLRSLAGALTRLGRTDVLVPGRRTRPRGDGAFDVWNTGGSGGWPGVAGSHPLLSDAPAPTVLLDGQDGEALAYVRRLVPDSCVLAVVPPDAPDQAPDAGHAADGALCADGADGSVSVARVAGHRVPCHRVGAHVGVNPLATTTRHVGFGFTDYLLVLSDRRGRWPSPAAASRRGGGALSALAAWLVARFARQHVVVVESGRATAWRSRALRGVIPVDSRTDLWRLMAHARLTVDLDPGPLLGRECVESLRLGTPVVVPAASAAAGHAHDGGGLTYRDVPELLWAVAALSDDELRAELSGQGREVVDQRYGDAVRFVDRVRSALTAVGGPTGEHHG